MVDLKRIYSRAPCPVGKLGQLSTNSFPSLDIDSLLEVNLFQLQEKTLRQMSEVLEVQKHECIQK
jgi:hypothetical protein